jgi:hypothetical protein
MHDFAFRFIRAEIALALWTHDCQSNSRFSEHFGMRGWHVVITSDQNRAGILRSDRF